MASPGRAKCHSSGYCCLEQTSTTVVAILHHINCPWQCAGTASFISIPTCQQTLDMQLLSYPHTRKRAVRLLPQVTPLLRAEKQSGRHLGLFPLASWSMLAPSYPILEIFKNFILYVCVEGVGCTCVSLHRYGDQKTTCESSLLLQNGSRDHACVSRLGAFTPWAISLVSIRPLPILWPSHNQGKYRRVYLRL